MRSANGTDDLRSGPGACAPSVAGSSRAGVEPGCEGLPGDTVGDRNATEPSAGHAGSCAAEDETADLAVVSSPTLAAERVVSNSLPAYPLQPRTAPDKANKALQRMKGRWLLVERPSRSWLSSFALAVVLAATVGVGILVAAGILETPKNIAPNEPASPKDAITPLSMAPARLILENGVALENESLPLGISVAEASGGESLMIVGLAPEFRLSIGTPTGPMAWKLSAHQASEALIHPPRDFVGVTDVVAELYSAEDKPVEARVARFEWGRRSGERQVTVQPGPSTPKPIIPRMAPEEITLLVEQGRGLLRTGDITSARISLKRAANAGKRRRGLVAGDEFRSQLTGPQRCVRSWSRPASGARMV